jgi:hypothetical protein
MIDRVLIPLSGSDVAPRFDLATEVLIASFGERGADDQRTIVLSHASADELCRLVLAENVRTVVCGAIEEEYYQYLEWKKVRILDWVIGPYERALASLRENRLQAGDVLFAPTDEK